MNLNSDLISSWLLGKVSKTQVRQPRVMIWKILTILLYKVMTLLSFLKHITKITMMINYSSKCQRCRRQAFRNLKFIHEIPLQGPKPQLEFQSRLQVGFIKSRLLAKANINTPIYRAGHEAGSSCLAMETPVCGFFLKIWYNYEQHVSRSSS